MWTSWPEDKTGNCWALLGSSFLKSYLQSMKRAAAMSPQWLFLDAGDEIRSCPGAAVRSLPTTSGDQQSVQSISPRDSLQNWAKEPAPVYWALTVCQAPAKHWIFLHLDKNSEERLTLGPPFTHKETGAQRGGRTWLDTCSWSRMSWSRNTGLSASSHS